MVTYIICSTVPALQLDGRMVWQGIHTKVHYVEYHTGMAVGWKDGGMGDTGMYIMWSIAPALQVDGRMVGQGITVCTLWGVSYQHRSWLEGWWCRGYIFGYIMRSIVPAWQLNGRMVGRGKCGHVHNM